MTENEIIKKIQSRGFWKVRFTPVRFDEKRISDRKTLLEYVEKSVVRLRGWDYPHYSHWGNQQERRAIIGDDYIEGGSAWRTQIEFWRMYQSGQFIHLFALDEDWWAEDSWYSSRPDLQKIKPGEVLGIISALYNMTEIFEFLYRLTKLGIYDDGVDVSISIENSRGRKLKIIDDVLRAPLFEEYKSHQESVKFEKELLKKEIIEEHKKLALDAIIWIFESFNWTDSPREVFEQDQKKFYERRF